MSLIAELKRRNIFRVSAAYAIVGWLLIQVIATVLPMFEAPLWIAQTITFIIILGFPFAILLSWAFDVTPQGIVPASRSADVVSSDQHQGRRLNGIILGLLAVAVGFLIVDRFFLSGLGNNSAATVVLQDRATLGGAQTTASARVRRSHLNLGYGEPQDSGFDVYFSISPDGTGLAYVIREDGVARLYFRNLDSLEGRSLLQSDIRQPIFSAAGRSIVYFSRAGIQSISVDGGRPATIWQEILAGPNPSLRTVGAGHFVGTSYFETSQTRVFEVTSTTEPRTLLDLEPDEEQWFPELLPDGKTIIYTSTISRGPSMSLRIGSIDTRQTRPLIENAYNARYAPTGHIVFMRGDALWAAAFDIETLSLTGPEVLVISGIQTNTQGGYASYDFSADGTLVYRPGTDLSLLASYQLAWVDRSGNEEVLPFPPENFGRPRISPNGRFVAVEVYDAEGSDIRIYDVENMRSRILTFDPALDERPAWTPDSRRVIFWSGRDGGGLYAKAADGSGQVERITSSEVRQSPYSVTRDEGELIYSESDVAGADNVYVRALDGSTEARVLLDAPWDDDNVSLSPDNRWLAYESNEPGSGFGWVFVKPYPDVGSATHQVYDREAAAPRWGSDGQEIFFRTADPNRTLHVARIDTTTGFDVLSEEPLFATNQYVILKGGWDVAPDGQRFLFLKNAAAQAPASSETSLVMVTNWFEELKQLAPTN